MARTVPCLALYYEKANKHSLVPLLAAVETAPRLREVPVYTLTPGAELDAQVARLAQMHAPVVIGVSLCSTQARGAPALAASLRRALRGAPGLLLAGGPHASGDPAGTLACGFDAAAIGEGETSLVELLGRVAEGRPWQETPGIAYVSGGRLVRTPPPNPVDLDAVPCFARSHRRYSYFELTRGCPWGCRFCQVSRLFGSRPRHRGIRRLEEDIARFTAMGNRFVRFLTPNALAYGGDGRSADLGAVERLLRAARAAAPPPARLYFGSFPSEVRPDFVSAGALELIRAYADNTTVVIGAQSASDRMLERLARGHGVREVYRATELALRAGLEPCVDFIVGLPGEEVSDLEASLRAIEELARAGARIRAHSFMPLPGTPLAGAKPSPVPQWARERLQALTGSGRLFGKWEAQGRFAEELAAGGGRAWSAVEAELGAESPGGLSP